MAEATIWFCQQTSERGTKPSQTDIADRFVEAAYKSKEPLPSTRNGRFVPVLPLAHPDQTRIFSGEVHRSAMMHAGQSGLRALQT